MTDVAYPAMRREVLRSIAKLADVEYQDRVWVGHRWPHEGYYDSFDTVIHWLFDDLDVLPDPDADGLVLLAGAEITRLRAVGSALDPLIDRLGNIPDANYIHHEQWPLVVDLASRCLPAMLIGGGWEHADPDARIHSEQRAEGRVPTVSMPATRRHVIKAIAALADDQYQRRRWIRPSDGDPVTGSLSACLRTLTADARVLPDPNQAIGRVLLAGDEIARLATLWTCLEPFRDNPPDQPWQSPRWPAVVAAALHCLPALVISGAWAGPDPPPAVQA